MSWYKRALARDENRPDAWLGMSIAALYGQKPELALDHAARAEALDGRNPEAPVVQAMAHAILGQRAEAKAAAERARRIVPGIPPPPELEALLGP